MSQSALLNTANVAEVLAAMGKLMDELQASDMALQDALSTLAGRAKATPDMVNLQHVDLVTQTHGDLAKLLRALSNCLDGVATQHEEIRATLTLRSLQDSLLPFMQNGDVETVDAGELSLF